MLRLPIGAYWPLNQNLGISNTATGDDKSATQLDSGHCQKVCWVLWLFILFCKILAHFNAALRSITSFGALAYLWCQNKSAVSGLIIHI
jgi:hypothetical protein